MELNLRGKRVVVTGGGGAICGAIIDALADEGALIAVWDISAERAERCADAVIDRTRAIAVECDATDRTSVRAAAAETRNHFEKIDILINGAGGSRPSTTTSPDLDFFDIDVDDMKSVLSLNYLSAVIPSQEIGRDFAARGTGVILNIASVAGIDPLTRSITYSDAKAATISFTEWLAVHMAQTYSPRIRVNAIAPGFILTDQNRFLLIDQVTGEKTERGESIVTATPVGRLGNPDEIAGTALFLVSDQASFITGAVIPVDGGYTAFSGV